MKQSSNEARKIALRRMKSHLKKELFRRQLAGDEGAGEL